MLHHLNLRLNLREIFYFLEKVLTLHLAYASIYVRSNKAKGPKQKSSKNRLLLSKGDLGGQSQKTGYLFGMRQAPII
jgi:hypothetical protein